MSFDATEQAIATGEITNNGFYPVVSIDDFVSAYSIPVNNQESQIVAALTVAIANINFILREHKQRNWGGFTRLADVPQNRLNDFPELVSHYLRAVYCCAKSELLSSVQNDSLRDVAKANTQLDADKHWHWLNQSFKATERLMGEISTSIELI